MLAHCSRARLRCHDQHVVYSALDVAAAELLEYRRRVNAKSVTTNHEKELMAGRLVVRAVQEHADLLAPELLGKMKAEPGFFNHYVEMAAMTTVERRAHTRRAREIFTHEFVADKVYDIVRCVRQGEGVGVAGASAPSAAEEDLQRQMDALQRQLVALQVGNPPAPAGLAAVPISPSRTPRRRRSSDWVSA